MSQEKQQQTVRLMISNFKIMNILDIFNKKRQNILTIADEEVGSWQRSNNAWGSKWQAAATAGKIVSATARYCFQLFATWT